jgi:hypothetical protein
MNATHLEAIQMVQKLSYRLEPDDYERVDVVVSAVHGVRWNRDRNDHLPSGLGRDVHWQESGAYRAISPGVLRVSGWFVIVGHSSGGRCSATTAAAVALLARRAPPG